MPTCSRPRGRVSFHRRRFLGGRHPITVVGPGQSGTSTITVSPTNGFTGTVALTCSGLPAGASCSVQPNFADDGHLHPDRDHNLGDPDRYLGCHRYRNVGSNRATRQQVNLSVTAAAVPDFTLSAGAISAASVAPGGSATSIITVGAVAGFSGTVALTCAWQARLLLAPTCALAPTSVANALVRQHSPSRPPRRTPCRARLAPHRNHGFGWLAASSGALFAGIVFLGRALASPTVDRTGADAASYFSPLA